MKRRCDPLDADREISRGLQLLRLQEGPSAVTLACMRIDADREISRGLQLLRLQLGPAADTLACMPIDGADREISSCCLYAYI